MRRPSLPLWNTLLPDRPADRYDGRKAALWILALIILLELAIGFRSVFAAAAVATSADGIPLSSYPAAAARTVVSLFALLGMSRLVLGLLGVVVLARYRALVPLTFALLLLDALGRRLVLGYRPIARSGGAGGSAVTLLVLGLVLAGLMLSLWRRKAGRAAGPV